ncbi:MAG: DUF2062 domain-containing protein [Pirellulaceae bacterium]|nr:DUF2062 domain-containing protein [Pirellulaceae bacterium]
MMRRRIRFYLRRTRRYIFHNILRADDPPHRLAMGMAIAMFITFTPTIGFQMALVVFFTWLFRANKLVGLPLVWISNPATIVPIYYGCYVVGRLLLGSEPVAEDWEWWAQLPYPPAGWWPKVSFYWERFLQILPQLCLGGVVVGLVAAIPTYYATYYGVRAYRLRRWGQLVRPGRQAPANASLARPAEAGPAEVGSAEVGKPM